MVDNDISVYPILLAGGVGSRLWPKSTKESPKQFSALLDDLSLFQTTVLRYSEDRLFKDPIIVTGTKYVNLVEQQMLDIGITDYEILVEPVGRDTGPAIALATAHILEKDKDAIMLFIPSDHYIPNHNKFIDYLRKGSMYVDKNIIIFGIHPTKPETGYGYIKSGKAFSESCYQVDKFTEKPCLEKAEKYLNNGDYYWNSGIYMFKCQVMMNAFKEHVPQLEKDIREIVKEPDFKGFENVSSISIDYAITEKSDNVVVVTSDIEWNDIGSWQGLWTVLDKDIHGNHINSSSNRSSLVFNTSNCLAMVSKPITINGLFDIAIVEADNIYMILNMDYSQNVKGLSKMPIKTKYIESHHVFVKLDKPVICVGISNLTATINNDRIIVSGLLP